MTAPSRRRPDRVRDLLWFVFSMALPLPWIVAHAAGGMGLPPEGVSALAGLGILGAAFLLSWATELAERDIPQSLALIVLALVSVLPEYAVDLHFAWEAGRDPSYAHYAVANMTGANRLLIGLGWAAVVLLACARSGGRLLEVEAARTVELRYLAVATLYSFAIPLDGRISLFDAAILFAVFAAYVRAAMRGETHGGELVGPPALLDSEFSDRGRRAWALWLFAFAAFAICVSAEPFADGLVTVGRTRGIDEFLLVQWVAPLASESPEFVIALLFALRHRGSVGLGALISSKVNQWTLLVGALPIAYGLSAGTPSGLPLDARQQEELLLTSAQSLLAAVFVGAMAIRRSEALLLAGLFLAQVFLPSTEVRYGLTGLYLLLAGVWLVRGGRERRARLVELLVPHRLARSADPGAAG